MEAQSGNNNVLFATRRAGKTSLAMRLGRNYRAAGGLATFTDLNGVPSADAAADRIATALFAAFSVDNKIFARLSRLVTPQILGAQGSPLTPPCRQGLASQLAQILDRGCRRLQVPPCCRMRYRAASHERE